MTDREKENPPTADAESDIKTLEVSLSGPLREDSRSDSDLHELATHPGTTKKMLGDDDPNGDGRASDPIPGDAAAVETDGIQVVFSGCTDVGLVREHNEDNFIVAELTEGAIYAADDVTSWSVGPRGLLFAVCDGMGGAAAGEVASRIAVDTLYEILREGDVPTDRDDFARRLLDAVHEAGHRILTAAKEDRTRYGMGTTATVAGLIDKVLFVGQVGDSRAYVLRGDQFTLITKDQSLVNQLVEAGQLTEEEAEAFEHSNIILQALGTTEDVQVDLTFLELRKGDRLLLCSDGLSGLVHAELMREVLRSTPRVSDCCLKLKEMARSGGGHDNITVIVAEFRGFDLEPAPGSAAVGYQQYPLPPLEDGAHGVSDETRNVRTSLRPAYGDSRPPETRTRSGQRRPRTQPKGSWVWIIVAALLIAAAVGFAVVLPALGPRQRASTKQLRLRKSVGQDRVVTSSTGVDASAITVAVKVTTDIAGAELFVDGHGRGTLAHGGETSVLLAPGVYRLEARTAGNVVASSVVTIHAGTPTAVALSMPKGATERHVADAGVKAPSRPARGDRSRTEDQPTVQEERPVEPAPSKKPVEAAPSKKPPEAVLANKPVEAAAPKKPAELVVPKKPVKPAQEDGTE